MKTNDSKRCEVCPAGTKAQTTLTPLDEKSTLEEFKTQVDAHLKQHGVQNNLINGLFLFDASEVLNNKLNFTFAQMKAILELCNERDKNRDEITELPLSTECAQPIRQLSATVQLVKALFIATKKDYTTS